MDDCQKGQIDYRQSRPMEGIGRAKRRKLPLTIDCSAFVTICYNWAGAPDPNGLGYNGQGYTGTILSHGTQIARRNVRVGDLVVFGRGTGNHVCLVCRRVRTRRWRAKAVNRVRSG